MTLSLRQLPHGSSWYNESTMKLEPLRTEHYKRRTAAPASKSNFRKFRRKHDVRQAGRGRTIASGIPTRAGIPSRWMYCPRDNAAADCEAAGWKLDPKINRIARTPRSTAVKRSRSEYIPKKGTDLVSCTEYFESLPGVTSTARHFIYNNGFF